MSVKDKENNEIKASPSDLRLFLAIWALIFGVFLAIGFFKHDIVRLWAFIPFCIALMLQAYPKAIMPLYIAQIKLGNLLGFCISRIVLFLLFFLIFCPIGLFFKLIHRDVLNQKRQEKQSFFIAREKQPTSMKNQF